MNYLTDFDLFWQEVALRSKNNYGNFETGEQVEENVNKAIEEIAEEIKMSKKSKEMKESIVTDYNLK